MYLAQNKKNREDFLRDKFIRALLHAGSLDDTARQLAVTRCEQLIDLIEEMQLSCEAKQGLAQARNDQLLKLFATELFDNAYKLLSFYKLARGADLSLPRGFWQWLSSNSSIQDLYLNYIERLIPVLPDNSSVEQLVEIFLHLCELNAHVDNPDLIEKVFKSLESRTLTVNAVHTLMFQIQPIISNRYRILNCVDEKSYWSTWTRIDDRTPSDQISLILDVCSDLVAKGLNYALVESLISIDHHWRGLEQLAISTKKKEQQIVFDELTSILVEHSEHFKSDINSKQLFPRFMASLLLNPRLSREPKALRRVLSDAVKDALNRKLPEADLPHFLITFTTLCTGSTNQENSTLVLELLSKMGVWRVIGAVQEHGFQSSVHKLFNDLSILVLFFCKSRHLNFFETKERLLCALSDSSIRWALLRVAAALADLQIDPFRSEIPLFPRNIVVFQDPHEEEIIKVVLRQFIEYLEEQSCSTSRLFGNLSDVAFSLRLLGQLGLSKTELAVSLKILHPSSAMREVQPQSRNWVKLVSDVATRLLRQNPKLATLIYEDNHLSELFHLALAGVCENIKGSDFFREFVSGLPSAKRNERLVERYLNELEDIGFFECFYKSVSSIFLQSAELATTDSELTNESKILREVKLRLSCLLAGIIAATEVQDAGRRAHLKPFFKFLINNVCKQPEYEGVYPYVVGIANHLAVLSSSDSNFGSNFAVILEKLEQIFLHAYETKANPEQVSGILSHLVEYFEIFRTYDRDHAWVSLDIKRVLNGIDKFTKALFEPEGFVLKPVFTSPAEVYLAALSCGARFSPDFDLRKLQSILEAYPVEGLTPLFCAEETFECFDLGLNPMVKTMNIGSNDLSQIEKYLNPGGFEEANKRYQMWMDRIGGLIPFPQLFDKLIKDVSTSDSEKAGVITVYNQNLEQNLSEQEVRIIVAALLRYFNEKIPHLSSDLYHDRSIEAEQKIYSYLSSADQVVSHSLELLELHRKLIPGEPSPLFETICETLHSLSNHIQMQLRKCKTRVNPSSKIEFRLIPRKDPIDCWYGFLGDCCITDYYGNELNRSDFQPIRIVDCRGYIVGYVYVVMAEVEGRLSLVVAGIEPNFHVKQRLEPYSFVEGLFGALVRLVKRIKVGGRPVEGVYVNAGFYGLRDDGRISQLSEIRDAIRKIGNQHLKELSSPVWFPKEYSTPIKYVYDISDLN
ncbi:MAG: hypothetical protein NZT61_07250 [Deltaproteobacteria bacterium]|nr:hypothetical protein [Deltaproteobacteria bacterium]